MSEALGQLAEPATPLGARRWRFAAAVFDERTLELTLAGQRVEMERKPLEVLRHLLELAGDVVTQDELLDAVWGHQHLSPTVLAKSISRLREGLGDEDQSIIKTVRGYGYRLVAPAVVEFTERTQAAQHFDFKPGDHPAQRPLWSLVEKLGAGGQGEVWLIRHDKTGELRVLKFAKDDGALSALKREVTLFRLLDGSLGRRAEIVRVLDWNFGQAPFFIESEYLRDGSLTHWAQARGGVHDLPLAERVEIIARIAEAVAALHSVGVLHKDLKPSNVLVIQRPQGAPAIKLCDFGSGGLLDRSRLDAMGITRGGFTQTLSTRSDLSGTPLYLAPEVLGGQPPTVQADVYALGVMLYQIVVADFHRQLNAGWEREIGDELLREDIAAAASGDPQTRLSDAGELARRLRALTTRRAEREAEREARTRAEAEERARDRWQARRAATVFALVAMAVGLVVSSALYLAAERSRDQAQIEAARARSVSDFLNQDVLSTVSSGQRSVKDLTVRELLDAAAAQIGTRFDDQPQTAAEIHHSLGGSYLALEQLASAEQHLDQALALYEQIEQQGFEPAVKIAAQLLRTRYSTGEIAASVDRFQRISDSATLTLGVGHPALAALRLELAWAWTRLGDWSRATAAFAALVEDSAVLPTGDPERARRSRSLMAASCSTAAISGKPASI